MAAVGCQGSVSHVQVQLGGKGGGGHVRGPAGEPGRSGVGGEGFDCTERSDKMAEKGGGDRKASLIGITDGTEEGDSGGDGGGVSMLVTPPIPHREFNVEM